MSDNINLIQLLCDFNSTLLDLANNIADICPNSIIGNNISYIKNILKNSKDDKFIGMFIIKVLPYKKQIDEGDENFFMNKSYEKDLENTDNSISQVFEIKNIWTTLSIENKNIVKQYFQILCGLAQNYFLIKYNN